MISINQFNVKIEPNALCVAANTLIPMGYGYTDNQK